MKRDTLESVEREANRLRAGHAGDPATTLAISFDLHIRRFAARLARRQSDGRKRPSTAR